MARVKKSRRLARSAFALACAAATGCVGRVEDVNPANGTGAAPAAGATSMPSAGSGGAASGTGGTSAAAGGTAGATGGTASTSGGTSGAGGTGATPPVEQTPPAPANPGTVTVRRLNRVEYDNTVRDLLGTSLRPAEEFQADSVGNGIFDTVGAAASLSPAAVRDFESAAYELVDDLHASPERWARVVPCDVEAQGEACARTVLSGFARRAFRRPVTDAEVDALLTPFREAERLVAGRTLGLRHSLAAVLMSSHFLFKLEIDPDVASTAPRRLNDHELATRLSYALWSTMPDDELFAAADAGMLQTDAVFSQQLERMLADPRAAALGADFAGQWLEFRSLESHEVAADAFPSYSPELARSMKREAELFFMDFLTSPAKVSELLTARFTYLDARLAEHYGIPAANVAPGETFRADTSGHPRVGMLTLGALLTARSFSSRTSPTERGEFVLSHLLCQEVPQPPPDVMGLPDQDPDANEAPKTLRERLEQHRADPKCVGCHLEMDPIGFGLENYDAIGRYRTEENGIPVDSAGELPDGSTFSDAVGLATLLAQDPRFQSCLTKNLIVFATGRFLNQRDDAAWVAHIAGTARDGGDRLGALVRTMLRSDVFRSRQAVVAP